MRGTEDFFFFFFLLLTACVFFFFLAERMLHGVMTGFDRFIFISGLTYCDITVG